MTWAELKKFLESRGVTDDMIIQYIEVNFPEHPENIVITIKPDWGASIHD